MTNEEAISCLQKMVVYEDITAINMAIKALKERPKGQWLPVCDEKWRRYICSRCGNFEPYEFVLDGQIKEQWQSALTQAWDCRYCPHCGAEMEKEE